MDPILISRARDRLQRLRGVSEIAHDPNMIEQLNRIADELEADILKVESGEAETLTMHVELPPQS